MAPERPNATVDPAVDPAIEATAVGRHYASLAGDYSRRRNRACDRAYAELLRRSFAGCKRVAEVGAGASGLLAELPLARRVGCDASLPMLAAAERGGWLRAVARADRLPFADASLDGIVAVNLLEHLDDPGRFVREAARALAPGGRLLAVTPNGDLARLLELLERLRLKLPEGPHRFLRRRELAAIVAAELRVVEHRGFLAFPAGPESLVRSLDRWLGGRSGRGLFQYVIAERREGSGP